MIVAVLASILLGSLGGAVILWAQGASFWGIALGYACGGWAGLLLGGAAMLLGRTVCRGGRPRSSRTERGSAPQRRARARAQEPRPAGRRKTPAPLDR